MFFLSLSEDLCLVYLGLLFFDRSIRLLITSHLTPILLSITLWLDLSFPGLAGLEKLLFLFSPNLPILPLLDVFFDSLRSLIVKVTP